MIDLISIACFMLIATCAFLLGQQMIRQVRDPVPKRLAIPPSARTESPASQDTAIVESLAAQLPLLPGTNENLDEELRSAGFYQPKARHTFLACRNALTIGVAVVTGVAAVLLGPEQQEAVQRVVLAGAVLATLCWGLPRLILKAKAKRRVDRITRSLPFALDMITMCLAGGLSLRDALTHVIREMDASHPDLAFELAIVERQADMTSLNIGLRQFASRIASPEIVAMAELMIQGQQLGTDVVGTFRDYAESMRLKWRQRADERASKVGAHIIFPVALCLLPAAFIVLWGPAVLELWDFLQQFEVRPPTGEI